MIDILSLNLEELEKVATDAGEPKYRAKQLFSALACGKTVDEITNIPSKFKTYLNENYITTPLKIIQKKVSSEDGTTKFLYELFDGNVIEGVLMSYKHGNTLCVSTQVGCRMGCAFCASGLDGLVRHLSSGEILAQVVTVNRLLGGDIKNRKITNLVLMGSGEPLDNYDNTIKFLDLVNDKDGINISFRNISLSTCGLAPKIKMLADSGYHVNLSLSLHASNDEIRHKIMPISRAYTMEEVLDSIKYYFKKTGRRIIIEYTLIKGINDSDSCAKELASKLRGIVCLVNVIKLNEVKEKDFISPKRSEVYDFAEKLNKYGQEATVRRTMGDDIDGACGQLRKNFINHNIK